MVTLWMMLPKIPEVVVYPAFAIYVIFITIRVLYPIARLVIEYRKG